MVGVVIPVYNGRDFLHRPLNSLVTQNCRDFRVYLGNDNDGLDYSDILTEYRARGLQIQECHTAKNGGPGAGRQVGIDAAAKDG